MAELKAIQTKKDDHLDAAKRLCLEAAGMGFIEVAIIGRLGDGTVAVERSKTMNQLEFIGALEWAKHEGLTQWGSK